MYFISNKYRIAYEVVDNQKNAFLISHIDKTKFYKY